MKLDFFTRRAHYLDHLAPVWNALPSERRGVFHVAQELKSYAHQEIGDEGKIEIYHDPTPRGDNPILVSSYGDIARAGRNPARKIIHMEHGTGHAFGKAPYPNGAKGQRNRVDIFLAPNEYTARMIRSVRSTRVEVIGTPKMDKFLPFCFPVTRPVDLDHPVIAIAFHWGSRDENPPESGSAWEYYRALLPQLSKRYNVLGHSHPLATSEHREVFEHAGIEWVEDFREILRRADVYVNDLSSTMYEFLLTGKPIVVLNAPWFRRHVQWGIRFWDYSKVGVNVENPGELFWAIDQTIREYGEIRREERRRAVADLYPYAGCSAERAAGVITSYLEELEAEHAVLAE